MNVKIKLVSIFAALVLSVSAFAGTVSDSANLFGPDASRLAARIENQPLYVETFVATPGVSLKQYADRRVQELTSNGFLLVVTSQPREWRISMYPIGLASSERVRQIGDQMVTYFKRGRHAEGVAWAAGQLALATQPAEALPAPVVVPVNTARHNRAVAQEESSNAWIYWAIGLIILAVIVAFCIKLYYDNKRQEEERLEEIKRQHQLVVERLSKKKKTAPQPVAPPAEFSEEDKAKANQYYNKYSTSERERIIREYRYYPQYNSSILDNPLMFYWFMTTIANNNQPHYVAQPAPVSDGYVPASAPAAKPSRDYESSYSPPERSRSDESGGGGSWSSPSSSDSSSSSSSYDSGGSSFDSGSSASDSSGGGGSW